MASNLQGSTNPTMVSTLSMNNSSSTTSMAATAAANSNQSNNTANNGNAAKRGSVVSTYQKQSNQSKLVNVKQVNGNQSTKIMENSNSNKTGTNTVKSPSNINGNSTSTVDKEKTNNYLTKFKHCKSLDEPSPTAISNKLRASNKIKPQQQQQSRDFGSNKSELKSNIKNIKELEGASLPTDNQSSTIVQSENGLSLRQKTPTSPIKSTLLNSRRTSQNRGEGKTAIAPRKLMPLTKASVMTDASSSANDFPSNKNISSNTNEAIIAKTPAKQIKFNYSIINQKVNNVNPNRLNMLNILINTGNNGGGVSTGGFNGKKILSDAKTFASKSTNFKSTNVSNVDLVDLSNGKSDSEFVTGTNNRSEFVKYTDDASVFNVNCDKTNNFNSVDDKVVDKTASDKINYQNGDAKSDKQKIFFSVSIQRPSVRFIRRTKSVFFT